MAVSSRESEKGTNRPASNNCRRPVRRAEEADRHAPGVLLPLSHLLIAILFLFAGMLMILLRPESLTEHHYHPAVVSTTHCLVLGWVLTSIMGSLYQMAPVVLETRLHSEKLGYAAGILHLTGTVLMIVCFQIPNIHGLAHAGALFTLGQCLFMYNLFKTLWKVRPWGIVAEAIVMALAWLALTIGLGLMMVLAKAGYFPHVAPMAWMHAHVHSGIAGCFVGLIMGISFKILPLFLLGNLKSPVRAQNSLRLFHLGLFVSVPSIAMGHPAKWIGSVIALMGTLLFSIEIRRIIRSKQRKQFDWSMAHVLAGLALLIPTACMGTMLSGYTTPTLPRVSGLETIYGLLAVFGVVGMGILGMNYKIITFLTWYACYSKEIGRFETPPLSAMFSTTLQKVSLFFYVCGLATACLAAPLHSKYLASWGTMILLTGIALFGLNIAFVLSHFIRPVLVPHRLESTTVTS